MAQSGFVLAVDGGQSSTLALAATHSGVIVGSGVAGPSNHVHEPGGLERLEGALSASIGAALGAASQHPERVTHVCLGMTGAMEAAREIVQRLIPHSTVNSYHDTVTALAGASIAQPGVVVIAGTGSIAYGRLEDGREAQAGGWGYIMGDEGSGYDIGREALRAATQAQDGRGASTRLLEAIPAHFRARDLFEVHGAIYSGQITRPQIAGLATVVAAATGEGDGIARGVLRRAGSELALTAVAVIARLGALEGGLAVYTTGGVFQAGDDVLQPFRETIAGRSPNSSVQPARFSPVVGALFLALQAARVALTVGLLDNIQASLPTSGILK